MKKKISILILLHILLLVYSAIGICSKFAAGQEFLSLNFCILYGIVLLFLFIYAVGWQQVIKRIPLNVAYANRAIVVFWGIVWGIVIFNETLSIGKIIGASLVVAGVVCYAIFGYKEQNEQ